MIFDNNLKMKLALEKHWDILLVDNILQEYLTNKPSITYKRSQNLRDILIHSHDVGQKIERAFGSKGPKWGSHGQPCGDCVACCNVDTACHFWKSQHTRQFKITHPITCSTSGVIYFATCPRGLIYVGLSSRQLAQREGTCFGHNCGPR